MTGKHPLPIGGRTVADELRDELAQCEDWAAQIGQGTPGLALLRRIDHIVDELERLEARGVNLDAERVRLENLLAQVRRRRKALVAQIGPTLAEQRPPEARWWWHLDKQVAADRRRRLMRLTFGVLAVTGLLVVIYVLYDRFVKPPAHIRQANQHFFNGEQAVGRGELDRALQEFETAAVLDPEYAEAHLWVGVLRQATGQADRATPAFEQARTLFDDELYFLLHRGLFYLLINDTTAAHKDALAAIEAAPEWPDGYFLLGNVAEQAGDLELAAASFQQTVDLAMSVGAVELEATARMRLSEVREALMTQPEP